MFKPLRSRPRFSGQVWFHMSQRRCTGLVSITFLPNLFQANTRIIPLNTPQEVPYLSYCHTTNTSWFSDNSLNVYSTCAGFESRLECQLYWLILFVVFLNPSRNSQIGQIRLWPLSSKSLQFQSFIYRLTTRRSVASDAESLFKDPSTYNQLALCNPKKLKHVRNFAFTELEKLEVEYGTSSMLAVLWNWQKVKKV